MKAYAAQLKRSTAERDRLISEHIEIARRISMRMARRCPEWIAREDLVAAGMLGLTEAAERYDANRNEPFLAFAEKRIRGAVLDELRRGDIMPRRARQMARKIGATIQGASRWERNGAAGETSTSRASAAATATARSAPARICPRRRTLSLTMSEADHAISHAAPFAMSSLPAP